MFIWYIKSMIVYFSEIYNEQDNSDRLVIVCLCGMNASAQTD